MKGAQSQFPSALPPIRKPNLNRSIMDSRGKMSNSSQHGSHSMMVSSVNDLMGGQDALTMMEQTLDRLRAENSKLRYQKEMMDREAEGSLENHNDMISKLHNLESVFIGDMDAEIPTQSSDHKFS